MSRKYDVLVGFDGSVEAKDALAWAVAEARSRKAGLTVVYVCEAAAYGLWTTTRTIRAGLRKLNQPVVDEALFEARRLDPDLFVRGRVVLGSPSRTLVSMSARSQLIVVGRQGKGALAAHLLGSVSQRLMAHAHCPVVAVSHPPEGGPADVVDRVVLAVGDPPIAGNALRFAQEEAGRRGIPLYAVHGWQVHGWLASGPEAVRSDPVAQIQRERHLVEELTAQQTDRARAEIRPIVRAGSAARVLTEFCQPTDLLVLGQHRHGHFLPPTLGAVISAVLHYPRCAVAVVPEPVVEVPAAEQAATQDAFGTLGLLRRTHQTAENPT
jgi:nucleotide-binding universal stress UspA family protein